MHTPRSKSDSVTKLLKEFVKDALKGFRFRFAVGQDIVDSPHKGPVLTASVRPKKLEVSQRVQDLGDVGPRSVGKGHQLGRAFRESNTKVFLGLFGFLFG